jgi:hypothetical protein
MRFGVVGAGEKGKALPSVSLWFGVSGKSGVMVSGSRSSVWGDAARRSCFLGDLIGESMMVFVGVSVFHGEGSGRDDVRDMPLLCLLVAWGGAGFVFTRARTSDGIRLEAPLSWLEMSSMCWRFNGGWKGRRGSGRGSGRDLLFVRLVISAWGFGCVCAVASLRVRLAIVSMAEDDEAFMILEVLDSL